MNSTSQNAPYYFSRYVLQNGTGLNLIPTPEMVHRKTKMFGQNENSYEVNYRLIIIS